MIDVNFDFTSDSPHYWDNFWLNNGGLGGGNCDPDLASKTMQKYHQELWSKQLPNGEKMDLQCGTNGTLEWGDFRFGSDSIIASFRYQKQRKLLEEVAGSMGNYREFVEDFLHRTYTIGGEMIFPKHPNSINQARGTNPQICDRFDLSLECIRKYYQGEDSPLFSVLNADKNFFDLFVDFKGFVNFFLLQDLVTENYDAIKIWNEWEDFSENPVPETADDYLRFLQNERDFVEARNRRIAYYV
jgi:hypothetical protein